MKIKPLKVYAEESINDIRYNENTVGICASVRAGKTSVDKKDYSALVLMSIMHKKNILKNELMKESFDEANKIIKSYEGSTL